MIADYSSKMKIAMF